PEGGRYEGKVERRAPNGGARGGAGPGGAGGAARSESRPAATARRWRGCGERMRELLKPWTTHTILASRPRPVHGRRRPHSSSVTFAAAFSRSRSGITKRSRPVTRTPSRVHFELTRIPDSTGVPSH